MSERTTPETDAAQFGTGKVTTDFARRLERERDEARNKMADALQEVDLRALDYERMKQERDEAREALRTLAEHGENEIQKLIKERDEAREENKKFREALEWIAERYDDSKPMHQVAMDAYEMSCTARAALRKEETK